ncbi:MAG TPA: hypothetical protein VE010_02440 [Thermoanaerobaculia bacterium]|nr:hypothetical protein [Thermoanaerobaculia bacterium]
MADPHYEHQPIEAAEAPVSLSRFFHTLRAYLPLIGLSLAAVLIGYLILAVLAYLLTPGQRVTTQRFRVDFVGAAAGKYPNGNKFAPTEIINTPILLKTYQQNDLQRFAAFNDVSRAIFVLEANTAYEELAAAYQSRLADPKLTPVDRERIQREFELKRESLAKNEYSINFAQTAGTAKIPEKLIRKVLSDILTNWANFAANEQHVLSYRVFVLSPTLLEPTPLEQTDLVAGVQILRSKVSRVMATIQEIGQLPAADLARTEGDRLSLMDLKVRFEEILRFRLEPLVPLVRASGLITDQAATMRFLEAQLAYDERELRALQYRAETVRQSLAVYSGDSTQITPERVAAEGAPQGGQQRAGDTVMPQLSDSFLDRVVALASQSADTDFRQRLVNQYRDYSLAIIPAEQAVAYDRQLLEQMRSAAGAGGGNANAATVRQQLDATRNEVRQLVVKVNEIYTAVSRNLNPSTQLFTLAGPPVTRVERSIRPSRILLWGLALFLIAIPLILLGVLLHARIRQEERDGLAPVESPAPASRMEGAA